LFEVTGAKESNTRDLVATTAKDESQGGKDAKAEEHKAVSASESPIFSVHMSANEELSPIQQRKQVKLAKETKQETETAEITANHDDRVIVKTDAEDPPADAEDIKKRPEKSIKKKKDKKDKKEKKHKKSKGSEKTLDAPAADGDLQKITEHKKYQKSDSEVQGDHTDPKEAAHSTPMTAAHHVAFQPEKELPKAKKSEKRQRDEEAEAQEPPENVAKKTKITETEQIDEPGDQPAGDKKHKKHKKAKKIKTTDTEVEADESKKIMTEEERQAANEDGRLAKEERKAEKKRKREADAEKEGELTKKSSKKYKIHGGIDATEEAVAKSKKTKTDAKDDNDPFVDDEARDAGDNWNVKALGGGSNRQDKFLRLLGGKKHGSSGISKPKHGSEGGSKLDMTKVQDDLQRQFDAGIKMKFESDGKRKGLGA
jgi:hypothetical protein